MRARVAMLSLVVAACSSASVGPDASSADAGLARDPGCPTGAAYVATIEGAVVVQSGEPLAGAKAQLCIRTADTALFLCLEPADTRVDGRFRVELPREARCIERAAIRVLAPLTPRAATYCRIDPGGALELALTAPIALFDTSAPRALPPLDDAGIGRTVVFDDGLELDLVPSRLFASYEALRGARVPLDHPGLCFVDAPFDVLYAVSPEGELEGRAPIRVPNTAGLAPGRRARLYVLGSLGCALDDGAIVPEAEWAEVDVGEVSEDGQILQFSRGLPCLSWFAIRAE